MERSEFAAAQVAQNLPPAEQSVLKQVRGSRYGDSVSSRRRRREQGQHLRGQQDEGSMFYLVQQDSASDDSPRGDHVAVISSHPSPDEAFAAAARRRSVL